MVEYYAREILAHAKHNGVGKVVIDKNALKDGYESLTKAQELFIIELDRIARILHLRFEIWTREDSNRYYFIRWETYRWRLS